MSTHTRTASEIVRDVIERDPVIRNGLARGLINVRALARQIQLGTSYDVTFEGLVAAIRRYPIKETAAKRLSVGKLVTKLSMKNEIVDVEIQNEAGIPESLARFSQRVDSAKGESLSVAFSVQKVVVVIDSKNLDKLMEVIPKKNVLHVFRNLAEVSVGFADPYRMTPGVYAAATNEVATEGINVMEYFHTAPSLSIIVEEKDALRTYQAMERLRRGK